MRKLTYLAVFEPANDGGYGVYFPDLPGCTSYGETFAKARELAADALGLHIYGMEKDGDAIPEPSERPEVDPETAAGFIVSPVTIFPDMVSDALDNRKLKTNVTLPAWLKAEAEEHNVNFSKVLESALMDVLHLNRKQTKTD